jgi:predicted DsbA family dithiol-disulfide isomerase
LRAVYFAQRFPDTAQVAARQAALCQSGREIGIEFRFDRITHLPNTRAAHALMLFAAQAGCADAMLEALFSAYFAEGLDIGDPAVLAGIGAARGLDRGAVAARMAAHADFERVESIETMITGAGVTGVPHYVFGGRFAFSGAQDVATFCRAIDAVAA